MQHRARNAFYVSSPALPLSTALERRQAVLLVQFQECIQKWVEVAGYDFVEVEVLFAASFAAEAVIGAAVLRKVVGADALGAVARAHHGFAGVGLGIVQFLALGFIKRGAEQRPGALLILPLAFHFRYLESQPRGLVANEPAGFDFIDVLPGRGEARREGVRALTLCHGLSLST